MNRLYLTILLCISLISCDSSIKKGNSEELPFSTNTTITDSIINIQTKSDSTSSNLKNLEGYWVLSDYYDNIIKHKTIAKYFNTPLSLNAWALRIVNDSLFTEGRLIDLAVKLHDNMDTLAIIDSTYYAYVDFKLSYNKKLDQIIGERIGVNDKRKQNLFTYRRIKDKKLKSLIDEGDRDKKERILKNIFRERLLAWKYKSLTNESDLILKPNGHIMGFKDYTTYEVATYSGTSHPYLGYDAMFLSKNGKDDIEIFSWMLKGDTLTITNMLSYTGGDTYVLGTESYRYIKE